MSEQEFCPFGCYWECEHRETVGPERAKLRPVDGADGRPLSRCRECGDFFDDVVTHSRAHTRKSLRVDAAQVEGFNDPFDAEPVGGLALGAALAANRAAGDHGVVGGVMRRRSSSLTRSSDQRMYWRACTHSK
jgi:hypothetical protein